MYSPTNLSGCIGNWQRDNFCALSHVRSLISAPKQQGSYPFHISGVKPNTIPVIWTDLQSFAQSYFERERIRSAGLLVAV